MHVKVDKMHSYVGMLVTNLYIGGVFQLQVGAVLR